MTADQIVERERGEQILEERGSMSGSINIEGLRPAVENPNATIHPQKELQSLSQEQPQELPEETGQQDQVEKIISLSYSTETITPFDLVEERKRRRAA